MNSSLNRTNIRCLFTDIDGVLTDSKKTYDISGNVLSKAFCDKDFTAVNLLREQGIETVFLSADDRVNKALAASKGIAFLHSRSESKMSLLQVALQERNLTVNEIIYIGDDMPDLDCFDNLLYTFCPSDAVEEIRAKAHTVLTRKGGTGCIMEVYEMLKKGGL